MTVSLTILCSAVLCGRMVLYDGYSASFRTIKLRPRQQDCVVCGVSPCVTCPQNYDSWCSSCAPLSVLAEEDRVTCSQYKAVQKQGRTHLLVDVREKGEFEICHLENAISILKIVLLLCNNTKLTLNDMSCN